MTDFPDLYAELDSIPLDPDAVIDDLGTWVESVATAHDISVEEVVDWALRKIAKADTDRDAVMAQAEAQQARLDRWTAQALRGPSHDREFFVSQVERYAMAKRRTDPKWSGVSSPAGKVGMRKQRDRIEITDSTALFMWAQSQHIEDALFSYTEPKAVKAEIMKVVKGLAEVEGDDLPGVELVVGEVRPVVTLTSGDEEGNDDE